MTNNQKYALVTGATGGMGYEPAKLLAQHPYNQVLVTRRQGEPDQRAGELGQQYGSGGLPLARDLFEPPAAFAVYQAAGNKGIRVERSKSSSIICRKKP